MSTYIFLNPSKVRLFTQACDVCQENPVFYTGVMTINGELALCKSCHND